jgi:hypothetical protein
VHRWLLNALVCVVALSAGHAHHAKADAASVTGTPCTDLMALDLSLVPDAPIRIVAAQPIDASAVHPPFCEVSGYVTPRVGFRIALPGAKGWNGKFVQLGCGGYCGTTDPSSTAPFDCDDVLRRGYACIRSDNGHRSSPRDAMWAYNNLDAEVDHAYRGVHVTVVAGKAIVERHYGRAPSKTYFMGSSTGGRQALIAAQRFPWDFDGIVAGVPSLSVAGIHMNLLWGNRVLTNAAGEPLLTRSDLEILHRAVVAKCDLNDGIRDGLIGDPRDCRFNPAELACRGKRAGCLSAQQLDIVNKIYGGPMTARGQPIYMPGALKGSERTWIDWFSSPSPDNPRMMRDFVGEEFRYSAFDPDAGPTWQPDSFDFERDSKRLGVMEALYAAVNPDLRQFKAAGGKLIAFAGWSDAGGMPLHTVDYYEAVERVFGSREATQEFFRLFVLPGMGHAYGDGAFAADWLSYLEAWVEQGRAPDQLLSLHLKLDDLDLASARGRAELYRRMAYPLDPNLIEFARPVYPYPIRTKYLGHGDPRRAASFGPDLLGGVVTSDLGPARQQ